MMLGSGSVADVQRSIQMPGTRTIPSSRSDCGFSVVECVIVVSILLTLAALTAPQLLRARAAAAEASAVASLQQIVTAEESYQLTYDAGYATLPALGGEQPCKPSVHSACLLDESLAGGSKGGYVFRVIPVPDAKGQNTN
jgi:type II secretory pathway pseudopilin PulG